MKSVATAIFLLTSASAFVADLQQRIPHRDGTSLPMMDESNSHDFSLSSRRGFLVGAGAITGVISLQQSAVAIPLLTVDELGIILRDSPYSVQIVEFSGPKAETITVKLVDGTSFGLKDIIESSTDPRSPLKVAAACREVGVKTKFVDLEALLTKTPKKKLYTNQRVQDAQAKTKAQEERMRQDEEDRLAALQKMEKEEGATAATKSE